VGPIQKWRASENIKIISAEATTLSPTDCPLSIPKQPCAATVHVISAQANSRVLVPSADPWCRLLHPELAIRSALSDGLNGPNQNQFFLRTHLARILQKWLSPECKVWPTTSPAL